jgi:hypothetical protein
MSGKQIKHDSTHVAKINAAIADLTPESKAALAERIRNGGLGNVNAEAAFAKRFEDLPVALRSYALFQLENVETETTEA